MRLLHVTLGFLPATAWGGPVKIVHQNARELVRRGHEVTVYCTNLLNKHEEIEPGTFERTVDGIRVVYFDTWRVPRWPGTLGPVWLPTLARYLEREISTFDLVHLNGYRNLMQVPIARAARSAGVPLVMQPHGAMPVIVNSLLAKRLYDKLLGRQELTGVRAVIVGQESERLQALEHGVDPSRIHIVHNGIDLDEMDRLPPRGAFRRRLGIDDDDRVVLFLGRINRKKGTDMMVEAFARLDHPRARLVIAGPDDGQLAEVEALIRRHDLTRVAYLPGLLSKDEAIQAFVDADLFVLPCRTDTFPMAIIESCLTGTPMVVTDRCEIAGLIEERVAEVVPFDRDAIAIAIDGLLDNETKYSAYERECARIMADSFSLGAVVDRLESIYEGVVEEALGQRYVPAT